QCIEHLGLTLAESKQLLSTLQRHLLQQQVAPFSPRMRRAQTAAHPSSSRPAAVARFAPCSAPLRSLVRGWSIVTVSNARPRHSALYPLCSPSWWPQKYFIWKPSGLLWCPTG